MGLYDTFRTKPYPTHYGPNKTAVTVDVLEAGLALAFVLLAFCFLLVLPGFKRKEVCYLHFIHQSKEVNFYRFVRAERRLKLQVRKHS